VRAGKVILWLVLVLGGLWVATHWDESVAFVNRGWGVMPEVKERILRGERYTRGQ